MADVFVYDQPASRSETDVSGCVAFSLRAAARAVSQHFDRALAPLDLKATQFTLLAMIAGQEGPMAMTALADRLVMDRTTLSRNLKPLKARGLVTDVRVADRRYRAVALTPAGDMALRAARPRWAEAQESLVAALGATRWKAAQMLLGDAIRITRDPA